jgi:predicted amidophosphoribosyltransferase
LPVTHCGGKIDDAAMHDDVVTSSGGPERVCPNCHSIVGPGVQFCPHCGEPMGGHRSRAWPAVLAAVVAVILVTQTVTTATTSTGG